MLIWLPAIAASISARVGQPVEIAQGYDYRGTLQS